MKKCFIWGLKGLVAAALFIAGYAVGADETIRVEKISPIAICESMNLPPTPCFRAKRGEDTNYYVLLDNDLAPFSIVWTDPDGIIVKEIWRRSGENDWWIIESRPALKGISM